MNLLIIGGDERSICLKNILENNNFNTHSLFLNTDKNEIKNLFSSQYHLRETQN